MISNNLITAASFTPKSLQFPDSWIGHLPFAFWVIQELNPKIFVELGTHTGNSFFSFCQTVSETGLVTKCYAVDTWQGDEHAGFYNEDVFTTVSQYHQKHYAEFSQLLRMTFDNALTYFADESIELLHIDGLHTYDAIRHDFETWLPKLAPGAVIMFHDTNVRERNFGVWRLWEELQARYPNNIEFAHSHGLGVLQLNNAIVDKKLEWLQLFSPEKQRLKNYFAVLGSRQLDRFELNELKQQVIADQTTVAECNRRIDAYRLQAEQFDLQLRATNGQIDAYRLQAEQIDLQLRVASGQSAGFRAEVGSLTMMLTEIQSSTSWRLLAPLRWYGYQRQRAQRLLTVLPSLLSRAGGVWPLFKSVVHVWCQDGVGGVKQVARNFMHKNAQSSVVQSLPVNEPETLAAEGGASCDVLVSQCEEILFVSHEASRTGAPIFLLNVIRFLSGHFNLNCIILLCSGGELEQEFRALGPTIVLANRNKLDPLILNSLKKRRIKLIYSNTISNGMVQFQLQKLGCPVLCHVHELGFSIERHFGEENLKCVLASTTKFLTGSKAVERYFREQQKLPSERLALAYPFIATRENVRLAQQKLACSLDIPENAIVVGACGTLGWRKGTDLFLQVARRVINRDNKPIFFIWVGGPISHGDYHNLQYDAHLMGIDRQILFTGAVSSHLPYFARFDIFVLPSREDPFPLVVLDAASLGIPIVCFDNAGGAPEFVENDSGIVVPYLDVNRMADALIKLMQDEVLRETLGKRAREKVIEHHDTSVGGKRIAEIIKPYLNNVTRWMNE